jgi:hypothetical protein
MNEWIQKAVKHLLILREHTFKISENTLFDHKRHEKILEELKADTAEEKLRRFKPNWLRHVAIMKDNRVPKNNAELSIKWTKTTWETSESQIYESEAVLSRPNS